jgi:hypothetical protein
MRPMRFGTPIIGRPLSSTSRQCRAARASGDQTMHGLVPAQFEIGALVRVSRPGTRVCGRDHARPGATGRSRARDVTSRCGVDDKPRPQSIWSAPLHRPQPFDSPSPRNLIRPAFGRGNRLQSGPFSGRGRPRIVHSVSRPRRRSAASFDRSCGAPPCDGRDSEELSDCYGSR